MKTILFTLLCISAAYSNAQDTTFAKIYEPVFGELDQNYFVADAGLAWDEGLITAGSLGWHSRGFLARISPDGNLLWQKECTADLNASGLYFTDVISTQDSNFVAAGKVLDTALNEYHPICMRLNEAGDTLWTKTFELQNAPPGNYGVATKKNGHLIETSDSNILMGFHHTSFETSNANPDHVCLTKLNNDGSILWSKSFLGDSAFFLSAMIEALDSSIYVIGHGDQIGSSGYIVNLTSDGQVNWMRKYNGTKLHDIELDSNYLYLGWSNSAGEIGTMKLLLNGDHQTRVSLNFWGNEQRVRLCRRTNGNIVVTYSSPSNFDIGRIVELNENLELVQSQEVWMLMSDVTSIPDKGIYAIGYGPVYGVKQLVGNAEMGVVRFDSLMNTSNCVFQTGTTLNLLSAVTISSETFGASDSLISFHTPVLYQTVDFVSANRCVTFLGSVDENEGSWNETVSPNPSTGEFTISWGEYRNAEVIIYNSIGTEIYRTSANNSFVEFNLNSEAEGLFYYQLVDEDGSQSSGKLMVLK